MEIDKDQVIQCKNDQSTSQDNDMRGGKDENLSHFHISASLESVDSVS